MKGYINLIFGFQGGSSNDWKSDLLYRVVRGRTKGGEMTKVDLLSLGQEQKGTEMRDWDREREGDVERDGEGNRRWRWEKNGRW